ncbi:MAG: hypothetical protein RBR02_03355 [Desulfuromonadaceae bacterium]|nr:hypothetical protein [Desulfuromonadaceae bacterium]
MNSELHHQPETEIRWLCHICNFSSTVGSGYVCQRCFKITCGAHISPTRVQDGSGGARLEMVCAKCVTQGDEI